MVSYEFAHIVWRYEERGIFPCSYVGFESVSLA
jgi:hypothetical protein